MSENHKIGFNFPTLQGHEMVISESGAFVRHKNTGEVVCKYDWPWGILHKGDSVEISRLTISTT